MGAKVNAHEIVTVDNAPVPWNAISALTISPVDAPMFALVASVAQRRVGEFKAQNLANTAWAFATADQSDAPLFALVARKAQRRVGEFNAQGLANTAWAFATAD